MKKSELQQIIKEEISKVLNEEEGNFTLKFIKDLAPPSKYDGWGEIIMRPILQLIKSKGDEGISINDLFQHEKLKDVTELKPIMLTWINQMIDDGYLESDERSIDTDDMESLI